MPASAHFFISLPIDNIQKSHFRHSEMSKFPRRGLKTFSCRCAAQTFLGLNCDPVIFGAGSAPDRYLLLNFMGLNITFWNCQGIRSKRKELELYLNENSIDITALNETFLNRKVNFKIQGYDSIGNDRSTGQKRGVAFLVKHGLVVNKEFRNADFNIITDNEALAIDLELSCNQNLTLATIYCPNGKPNFSLFQTIYNLSDNVMFVGDFTGVLISSNCSRIRFLLKRHKKNVTTFCSRVFNNRL